MFRFTIRDLLWLMVVVSILCGWWLERSYDRRRFVIEKKQLYDDLDKSYKDEIRWLSESNWRLLHGSP
ncbi:MAG TPA: hypothetical protein VGI40_13155 [Pirellulaceae bacterium]|jgi:hypothetical protein